MSNRKKYFAPAIGGLCFLVAAFCTGDNKPKVYAQVISPPVKSAPVNYQPSNFAPGESVLASQNENLPTDKIENPFAEIDSPDNWAAAATENARLKDALVWTFGGKSQHGWYLYVPLIQHTIDADTEADSPEFASRVAAWQQKNKLTSSGVIDETTLVGFVKWWQSRRLNSSVYPTEDKLLVAPSAYFFDSSREDALRKVERETFDAYRRMIAAAIADKSLNLRGTDAGEFAAGEKFLKIVSAFRSREYQDNLRRKSPNSGSAGLAVNSPHFTGCAIDVYVGGDPVDTKDANRAAQVQTPVYKWLVKNAERFGFFPYYYEPWHWEYVGESGK